MSEEETTPEINTDELLSSHDKWTAAEKDAASDAGERRQQIGALAENMGIENKALSQFRAGLKIKKESKRRDWLRSMEALLPIARNRIFGNQSEMDLPEPAGEDDLDSQEEFDAAVDGNVVRPFDGEEGMAAE